MEERANGINIFGTFDTTKYHGSKEHTLERVKYLVTMKQILACMTARVEKDLTYIRYGRTAYRNEYIQYASTDEDETLVATEKSDIPNFPIFPGLTNHLRNLVPVVVPYLGIRGKEIYRESSEELMGMDFYTLLSPSGSSRILERNPWEKYRISLRFSNNKMPGMDNLENIVRPEAYDIAAWVDRDTLATLAEIMRCLSWRAADRSFDAQLFVEVAQTDEDVALYGLLGSYTT
ncbi:hypothetical protein BTUL_0071g00460 [Botrytis tulipae]|uniref:Uncharacterized protein n=1 Tax=Botrytis tulipae TaxID=87230 RepID=A0A4Z1ER24_9HELO|nr:hypothetical protein BTUL_0071g00460 [Botrytis tulipae]